MPTFATFVTSVFTPFYAVSKCRPATRERYAALLKQGLLAHFGEKRLDEIGPGDFRMDAAGLTARGIGARNLPDAPEADVIVTLLENAKDWLGVAIALAAYAGLRSGEVRAIEVRDVNLKRNELQIWHAFSASEVPTPKSGDERLVPIAPPLRDILVEAARDKLPHARLVVRSDGATPSRKKVLRSLQDLETRIAKSKEMQIWSFHQLRHSFCSTLVRNGVSVEAVRVRAGHADLRTTQRYVHASVADLKAAVLRARTVTMDTYLYLTRDFSPDCPNGGTLRALRQRFCGGKGQQMATTRGSIASTLPTRSRADDAQPGGN